MASDDKQHHKRTVRLAISVSVAVIAVGLVAFQTYSSRVERLALKKCEAMTPVERKAAFVRSLIALETRNAELSNRFASRGTHRVGLARNFDESRAESMVESAYANKWSFEDNFKITRFNIPYKDVEGGWREADALVSYSIHDGDVADFIPIKGVTEVFGVEQTGQGTGRFIRGRTKNGDHVFMIKEISLVRDCCDGNRDSSESDGDYKKRRLNAYLQTKKFFSSEFNGRDLYVRASACGNPFTKDGETNMGTHRLNFFVISEQKELSK